MCYDIHALGVYKEVGTLAGHLPIELSRVLDFFLKEDPDNTLNAEVTGQRKREVGLVVPARYTAFTKNRETAQILERELKRRKEQFTYFEFKN